MQSTYGSGTTKSVPGSGCKTAALGPLLGVLLASVAWAQADPATAGARPKISRVFFAQHHVHEPDHPYFKLVGGVDALVKVHIDGKKGTRSPDATARVTLGGRTLDLDLKGPGLLPGPVTGDPALLEHAYEDSFTAFIPAEWVAPGLKVTVELRSRGEASRGRTVLDRKEFDKLPVGAPTRLVMTMIDFHFFKKQEGNYFDGWVQELGSKLPVAALEVRRVRGNVLKQVVMPPRAGAPAVLCSSREEYQKKTGVKFDGEQATAGRWNGALKNAAGAGWGGTRELWYLNIYGVPAGGEAGGLSGVGNGKNHGILLHELGHAFGLPHWAGKKDYPYVGTLHGIPSDSETTPHVGPTWAFDPVRRLFIPPTRDGKYKRDPMQGGGADNGNPHKFRFFSDYSFNRIRDCLERTQVVWDERGGSYMQWDPKTGAYSIAARKRGKPHVPIEDDLEVISILACASLVTPEANHVYPPIGPYTAGLVRLYGASSPQDLAAARGAGFKEAQCNHALRVTQGGKTRTYLVGGGPDPAADAKDGKSFGVFAVNVPARDGEVTQVDLLHVPGILSRGAGRNARVVYSWKREEDAPSPVVTETLCYPEGTRAVASAPVSTPSKKRGGISSILKRGRSAKKPASAAKAAAESPADPGAARHWVGLRVRKDGALLVVAEVLPGSPAAKAGVVPGSRIFSVQDKLVSDVEGVRTLMRKVLSLKRLRMTLIMNGREVPVAIPIGKMRKQDVLPDDGF